MIRGIVTLLVVFVAATAMVTVPADDQIDETNTVALVKANFLYQFASNINWPEQNRKGKFIIGVYGNNTLFEEMAAKYGAKPVGNQVIEVVNLRDFNASRFVHILYVDKSKKADIQRIVKELKGESTLIVSSFDGGLTAGADINFRTVDSSIRYELNKSAMDAKKMTAGVKILQWAIK